MSLQAHDTTVPAKLAFSDEKKSPLHRPSHIRARNESIDSGYGSSSYDSDEFEDSTRAHSHTPSPKFIALMHHRAALNAQGHGYTHKRLFSADSGRSSLPPPYDDDENENEVDDDSKAPLYSEDASKSQSSPQELPRRTLSLQLSQPIPSQSISISGRKVLLESLLLSCEGKEDRLIGTVLVKNVQFEKRVSVRFTTDSWSTVQDIQAKWAESLPGPSGTSQDGDRAMPKEWDRFAFSIPLQRQDSLVILLAIRYRAPGTGEWWDNNAGLNYEAVIRKEDGEMGPEPVCPIDEAEVAKKEEEEDEEEDEERASEEDEEEEAEEEEEDEKEEEEMSVSGRGTESEETETQTQRLEEIDGVEELDSEEQAPVEASPPHTHEVPVDVEDIDDSSSSDNASSEDISGDITYASVPAADDAPVNVQTSDSVSVIVDPSAYDNDDIEMSPVSETESIVIEVVNEDVQIPTIPSSSLSSPPSLSLSSAAVQAAPEATGTPADVTPEVAEPRSDSESTPPLTSTTPLVNDSEFTFIDGDCPSTTTTTTTTTTTKPGKDKKKKETIIRRAERWLNKRLVALHVRHNPSSELESEKASLTQPVSEKEK